jgi:hypothetical protein
MLPSLSSLLLVTLMPVMVFTAAAIVGSWIYAHYSRSLG